MIRCVHDFLKDLGGFVCAIYVIFAIRGDGSYSYKQSKRCDSQKTFQHCVYLPELELNITAYRSRRPDYDVLPLQTACPHEQSMSGVFSIASHWVLQYLPDVVVQEQIGCAHFSAFALTLLPPVSDQQRAIQTLS